MIIKWSVVINHCDLYSTTFFFWGGGGGGRGGREGGDSAQLFPSTSSMSPFISLLHVFSVIALDICVHASLA